MPTHEQSVTQHALDEKPIDRWRVTFEVFDQAVEPHVENHANLQLSGHDRRCFERLHERSRIADARDRAIVNLSVDEIWKWNDGALLELRDAIGFKEFVKVYFDFVNVRHIHIEDIPVRGMNRKWNHKNPSVRPRYGAGICMLRNRSILCFPDDCRATADDSRVGWDEGNVDVLLGLEFSRKPSCIKDQIVAFGFPALKLYFSPTFYPVDLIHFRIDVAGVRAFV